jgi:hypothetical protein
MGKGTRLVKMHLPWFLRLMSDFVGFNMHCADGVV